MDGLQQLAWVAEAIKSPLVRQPTTRSASLAVLADDPPSDDAPSDVEPADTNTISAAAAVRPGDLRRRNLSRAAVRHGVSGLMSAEAYARALVLTHLKLHKSKREKEIRTVCPSRESSEQLRVLVAEGAVKRHGYGVNGDPYRYSLTDIGAEMVGRAREELAVDAVALKEVMRVVAAAPRARKPAKRAETVTVAMQVVSENTDGEELRSKRKLKATEPLNENHTQPAAAPAPAPRPNPATGFAAIYRALSRIKSRKRTARATPPAPTARARVRPLAPPPASAALTWDHHWARTWGSYDAAPRRERRAVGNILVSIADAVGGATVTGADLRRAFPGCPDHSKALTTVINAGWANRAGAGGRMDPFRYTATAAGVAAANAARAVMAANDDPAGS